ncbi:Uncharacterized protein T4D_17020 [Trichinella pseudospiralis]|uniref:SCAN domain-containing protein 3 n=1 Tax=Trichinella pseudospiralis TaxID=6337 RepID=A0A0V1FL31_TRIPS|nr:Uncharacterized protein T4D_17020 [Trichinella pseudospiralis]
MPLENFWVKLQAEYPKISSQSLRILVPFISTYLCETGFSSFMALNTQHQNRNILLWKLPWLNATMKQRVALRTLNTYYNKEEACADTATRPTHCVDQMLRASPKNLFTHPRNIIQILACLHFGFQLVLNCTMFDFKCQEFFTSVSVL